MDSTMSALDLLAALLNGRAPATEGEVDDHRCLLALLATSLAVLVGCGVVLLVRRSSSAAPQTIKASAAAAKKAKREEDPDPDDVLQGVLLFFIMQTGTVKGFAKDDYAAQDEEHQEKLKENIALFFVATLAIMQLSAQSCS